MTDVARFDIDAMVSHEPTDWQTRGIHWHCYNWRGSGKEWADDQARGDDNADITPTVVKAWLRKPARLIRATPKTPEDAVQWLRAQWAEHRANALHPVTWDEDFRFKLATYDLRCANDLSWALWLKGGSIVSLGIVGTAERCH